ncbi:MAG: Coenzyme F420 hydrogenase/dehydrogenase, beta subunit C-terminal domain, partial [Clostridiales bacterium]|nr:Coenzyme F420 hydrogenase/dehydrogenase, beta subunit C-terminal domain [Clostridiales bacterium]
MSKDDDSLLRGIKETLSGFREDIAAHYEHISKSLNEQSRQFRNIMRYLQPNNAETRFRKHSAYTFVYALKLPDIDSGEDKPTGTPGVSDAVCTGCGACQSVCPKQCVSMEENGEGFKVPVIGGNCVDCGKCSAVCPVINTKDYDTPKAAYAMMADDETRANCSSGGAFPAAARYVVQNGGYVCGAAWTPDFLGVRHKIVDNLSELPDLYFSKYLQSDTDGAYIRIKELLDNGKQALFCGCPCQVAGLKSYLGKEYSNLITMGLICHGVPSPKAWRRWLEFSLKRAGLPMSQIPQIDGVCMRDKSRGWRGELRLSLRLKNGTEIFEENNGLYFRSFLRDISLRKCCYDCKFKSTELKRPEDITIGDFWDYKRVNKSLSDGKGLSVVLINNERGREFFDNLDIYFSLKVPLGDAVQLNMAASVALPYNQRLKFFKAVDRLDYDKAVDIAFGKKTEVGVLGCYENANIGGQLTVLAAYKIVEKLGYSVKMVKTNKDHFRRSMKRRLIWDVLCKFTEEDIFGGLHKINDSFDSFVTCSDWTFFKTWIYGWDYFMQPWTSGDKRRIAFAASFGSNGGYSQEDYPELIRRLSRFDALSIRETWGVDFCKELGVGKAQLMHDPVFAMDKEFYLQIADMDSGDRAEIDMGADYLVLYLREFSDERIEWAGLIAGELGLKILLLMGYDYEENYIEVLDLEGRGITCVTDVTMCEWLYFISRSKFVITDS